MIRSGLSSAIHFFEKSKPSNTGFQYASCDFLLSHAAPIAGTCDTLTLATILATYLFPAAGLPLLPKAGPPVRAHSFLLRLFSMVRPPWSIICAYCSCVSPVIVAATYWNDLPSVENSFDR